MNIDGAAKVAATTGGTEKGSPDPLRDACRDFEGLMLGIVLKQGMATEPSEGEDFAGRDVFKEFALEQVARELGRSEATGLARTLYEQLRKDIGSHE
jgi:peptidoglycan hydrolase FlgJ